MSGELWLAEGFTQYYGPLALQRARLVDCRRRPRGRSTGLIESGRRARDVCVRSAEEMSRMAPFIDGGRTIDRTNWSNTVISYYPFGGAIALALDLTLRDRTDGRVSLDDFMRAMWRSVRQAGRRAAKATSISPYTIADAEATLAEVSGDRAFARDFFAPLHPGARGRRLRAPAGARRLRGAQAQRRDAPGSAICASTSRNGARVATLVAPTLAGLRRRPRPGRRAAAAWTGSGSPATATSAAVLQRHKPGDSRVDRLRRSDRRRRRRRRSRWPRIRTSKSCRLNRDGALTAAQKAFRDRWLGAK